MDLSVQGYTPVGEVERASVTTDFTGIAPDRPRFGILAAELDRCLAERVKVKVVIGKGPELRCDQRVLDLSLGEIGDIDTPVEAKLQVVSLHAGRVPLWIVKVPHVDFYLIIAPLRVAGNDGDMMPEVRTA